MPTSQAQTIPAPDAHGRLVLKEQKTNIFGVVLIIIAICALACFSAYYWYLMFSGNLPAGLAVSQIELGAAVGLASLLALPYCFKYLKNPPSLIIDNNGIELREPGQIRRMAWPDIREIKTEIIRDTRIVSGTGTGTFDPYSVTTIRGNPGSILLNADFGLTAATLTSYLIQRQNNAAGTGTKLTDPNAAAAQKFESKNRLYHRLQLWGIVIAIAGVIAFLGFLAWARMTLF